MPSNLKNKFIVILIIFTILSLIMSGCQKASINGDLDGRWQIMTIENSGDIVNVKDKQLYYDFYMHVCNLSYHGFRFAEANMKYENNKIDLFFPYIEYHQAYGTLNQFGVFSNPVDFEIIYLDKKKLIMQNDKSLLTCRKF